MSTYYAGCVMLSVVFWVVTRCLIGVALALFGLRVFGADVRMFHIGKGQFLSQTSSNIPSQHTIIPFALRAQAFDVSNAVTSIIFSAPVTLVGGLLTERRAGLWDFVYRDTSPTRLNGSFGNGVYTFRIDTTHDFFPTNVTLNLPADSIPPPLRVSNFLEAQHIDPTAEFTLMWDAPEGARVSDLITFSLESSTGTVYQTSLIAGNSNALAGTETSLRLPANLLPASRTVVGLLTYVRVTALKYSYSNAVGYSGWFSQTDFPLRTVGSVDSEPPVLLMTEPPQGATNIPQDAPLRFIFNEPMRTASGYLSIGLTNWTSSSWSADRRTFTITSTNLWKANSSPIWLLNSAAHPAGFCDAAGNLLLPEPMAIFNIGSGTIGTNLDAPSMDPPLGQGNNLLMTVRGQAFRRYGLERVATLPATNWTEVQSVYSTNGVAIFSEPVSAASFYRATIRP